MNWISLIVILFIIVPTILSKLESHYKWSEKHKRWHIWEMIILVCIAVGGYFFTDWNGTQIENKITEENRIKDSVNDERIRVKDSARDSREALQNDRLVNFIRDSSLVRQTLIKNEIPIISICRGKPFAIRGSKTIAGHNFNICIQALLHPGYNFQLWSVFSTENTDGSNTFANFGQVLYGVNVDTKNVLILNSELDNEPGKIAKTGYLYFVGTYKNSSGSKFTYSEMIQIDLETYNNSRVIGELYLDKKNQFEKRNPELRDINSLK